MSVRMCWTCNTEHDLDDACAQSATERSAQAAGGSTLFNARQSELGPVITARFDSFMSQCCGEAIVIGDRIRSDGQGGWVHANGECDE